MFFVFSHCGIFSLIVWSVRASRACADDVSASASVPTVGFIGNPVVVAKVSSLMPETSEPFELMIWLRPLQTICVGMPPLGIRPFLIAPTFFKIYAKYDFIKERRNFLVFMKKLKSVMPQYFVSNGG